MWAAPFNKIKSTSFSSIYKILPSNSIWFYNFSHLQLWLSLQQWWNYQNMSGDLSRSLDEWQFNMWFASWWRLIVANIQWPFLRLIKISNSLETENLQNIKDKVVKCRFLPWKWVVKFKPENFLCFCLHNLELLGGGNSNKIFVWFLCLHFNFVLDFGIEKS